MASFAFRQVRKAESIAAKVEDFFVTLRQRCAEENACSVGFIMHYAGFRSLKKLRESPR